MPREHILSTSVRHTLFLLAACLGPTAAGAGQLENQPSDSVLAFPHCSSDSPPVEEVPCLASDGTSLFVGYGEVTSVPGPRRLPPNSIALTPDQLQTAVVRELLRTFTIDTPVAEGELNWSSDSSFDTRLQIKGTTKFVEIIGNVDRDCRDADGGSEYKAGQGYTCAFTISFSPPVKGISGVSATIPYLPGEDFIRPGRVSIEWHAPTLLTALLNMSEAPLKKSVLHSVSGYAHADKPEIPSATSESPNSTEGDLPAQ